MKIGFRLLLRISGRTQGAVDRTKLTAWADETNSHRLSKCVKVRKSKLILHGFSLASDAEKLQV